MNHNLNKILLNRKNLISVNPASDSLSSMEKSIIAATASKNLESLGFRFSNDLIHKLKETSMEEILDIEVQVLENLEERLGADVEYRPMYPGFPDSVMSKSDMELYLDALIYAESGFTEMPLEYTLLKKEEEEAFVNYSKKIQNLKVIGAGAETDIENITSNLMASPVAFSQNDKDDIMTIAQDMRDFKSFIPEKIPNKENLTWLAGSYMQIITEGENPFVEKMTSATDILRLIASRSEGNTSLAEDVRFKTLSKAEAKMYALQLAKTNNTEADIAMRPEIFKRVFKQYHFPTVYAKQLKKEEGKELTNKYPTKKQIKKMLSISNKLYKDELEKTFESKRNRAAKEGNFKELVNLYKDAPGRLAKDMDWVIMQEEKCADKDASKLEENVDHLCTTFRDLVYKVDTNNLLKMQALINLRTKERDFCIYAPNKGLGNPYMKKETRKPIDHDITVRLNKIIDNCLKTKYAAKRPLGKVYIEKKLEDVKIPSAQRTNSKGAQTLPYGSQIDIGADTKNLRGFIWWTNADGHSIDIDLSATFYDKNWKQLADLAYYNLKGSGYGVHSGDIRNGGSPGGKGASEFIDINLDNLKKRDVGYVVFSVNSFSETNFSDTPCKFGWMEPEEKSKALYDPLAVQTAVQLNTESMRAVPVAFDVEEGKMVWMDRSPRGFSDFEIKSDGTKASGNNVATYATPIMVEAYKAVNLPAPSVYHLMKLHAEARGELVDSPEEADTIFSLNRINDLREYPNMKENICGYDNDAILGDLLPTALSAKDIEYFEELEAAKLAELEAEEKTEEKAQKETDEMEI